jgi:hypothetical protein
MLDSINIGGDRFVQLNKTRTPILGLMNIRTLKMRKLLIAAAVAAALTSSPAYALNFTFSFSNIDGNVPGTVTGEIYGLQNNVTLQQAEDIVLTGYPAGLGLPSAPLDVFTFNGGSAAGANSLFTVSGGQITYADFQISLEHPLGGGNYAFLLLNGAGIGLNLLQYLPSGDFGRPGEPDFSVSNHGSLAGVNFTPAPSATPLPSTWTMLLAGFVGVACLTYRRTKKEAAVLTAA